MWPSAITHQPLRLARLWGQESQGDPRSARMEGAGSTHCSASDSPGSPPALLCDLQLVAWLLCALAVAWATVAPFLTGQVNEEPAHRRRLALSLTRGELPVFRARKAVPSTAPVSQLWKQLRGETVPGSHSRTHRGVCPLLGPGPPSEAREHHQKQAEAVASGAPAPLTLSGGGSHVSPPAVCSRLVAAVGTGAGQATRKGEGRRLASTAPVPVAQLMGTA